MRFYYTIVRTIYDKQTEYAKFDNEKDAKKYLVSICMKYGQRNRRMKFRGDVLFIYPELDDRNKLVPSERFEINKHIESFHQSISA